MTKEKITHEEGDKEAWHCVCGNQPCDDGFYPCLPNGDEVEPSRDGDWDGIHYVCNGHTRVKGTEDEWVKCGRIINQETLEVVGRNQNFKTLN